MKRAVVDSPPGFQKSFLQWMQRWPLLATVLLLAVNAEVHSQGLQARDDVSAALERRDYQGVTTALAADIARGNISALTLAGLVCVNTPGNRCEPSRAIQLLTPGATNGNADAQYGLARILLKAEPPQTDQALAWLEKAAASGQVGALVDLGEIELANDDPAMHAQGVARLQRASEIGFAPAQFALGMLYEAGKNVTADAGRAARWYRAAAMQGHTIAQTRLGSLYERGLGIAKDAKSADRWYREAAEAGNVEAQYSLGMMYMLDEVIEPDYFEGIYWLEQAAKKGYAKAQDALGRAYWEGVGVRQDTEAAVRWFQIAGEQGYLPAQNNAGLIYEHDVYLRDYALAARWYESAAKGGYGYAMLNLGDLYRDGYGRTQSLSNAQLWYAQAAQSDNADIAEQGRQRMHSALSSSVDIGLAAFGLGERFPTAGALFDAIIAAAVAEKALYPNANQSIDPDVEFEINEIDRNNRAMRAEDNYRAMEAMILTTSP